MLVNDFIIRKIRNVPDDILSYSNSLQVVLNLNTKIFNGQGVSAAIFIEDKGFWTGASGLSETGKPADPDMLFNIASIGKNFLAALVLQLVEENRLSLDDSISKWDLGSSTIDESITVRQLLNHTSGIYDWVAHEQSPFSVPYKNIDYTKIWSYEEILTHLSGNPYFPPGNGWRYSTTNYNVLKIITEEITGIPVSVHIRERFLKPLDLKSTIAVDIDSHIPSQPEIAHGWFDVNGDGEPEDISGDPQSWIISMSPHMMYASSLDLAKWSQALYGGQVLSESSLQEMLDFHRPVTDEPPITGYGLGTEEISFTGLIRPYGHLGYHYGYMAAMLYFPKRNTSLVVLTNENNPSFQYGAAFGVIIMMTFGQLRYIIISVLIILFTVLWRNSIRQKG